MMKGILANGDFSWKWCVSALDLFSEFQLLVVLLETILITLDTAYFIDWLQIAHLFLSIISQLCVAYLSSYEAKKILYVYCSMFPFLTYVSIKMYKEPVWELNTRIGVWDPCRTCLVGQ